MMIGSKSLWVDAGAAEEVRGCACLRCGAGAAVRDAAIELSEGMLAAPRPVRVRTNGDGHAFLPAMPPGEVTVTVRKVGYAAGSINARVERGENTLPILLTGALAPTLACH